LLKVNDRIVTPDMLLKGIPRQELARLSDEHLQHLGGLRLEASRRPTLPKFACVSVELEVTKADSHHSQDTALTLNIVYQTNLTAPG